MNENILGFHVPVNDLILLHGLEGLANLPENKQCLLFRQLSIVFLDVLIQTAAVAVLQKYVQVIRCLGDVQHLHYKLAVQHLK